VTNNNEKASRQPAGGFLVFYTVGYGIQVEVREKTASGVIFSASFLVS